MIKEYVPYGYADSKTSFVIVLDKENNIVLEYNPRIKSLAKYKFENLNDVPDHWVEFYYNSYVIKTIFEKEIVEAI